MHELSPDSHGERASSLLGDHILHVPVPPRVVSDYSAQAMTTTMTTQSDPAPLPSPRSPRREQTISYADLMKPDEDWRALPNAADRRKIQNRLAQRAYRRSLRERNEEIKRLKKQVKQLEQTQAPTGPTGPTGPTQLGTPLPDPDAKAGPSVPSPGTAATPDAAHLAASNISTADWMSDYLGIWSQTPESDRHSSAGPTDCPLGSDLSCMDVTQEHPFLQPVNEPNLEHGSTTTTEAGVGESLSPCLQHHGEGGNRSSNSGNNIALSYPSLSLGSESARHTADQTMDKRASPVFPAVSPSPSHFTFGSDTQRPHTGTSRSVPYSNRDGYSGDHSPEEPYSFSVDLRLPMETGNSHQWCRPATALSYQSQGPPARCCCKSAGDPAAAPSFSVHSNPNQDRQGTPLQLLEIPSLQTQRQPLQGLVVEPSDSGDGLTIKLQPAAMNGRTSLVAFVIQCDASSPGDKPGGRGHRDSHHGAEGCARL
ncbi:hypothetical protein VTI74DRAFT_3728 [Chaetomium olivicolor]